MSGDDRRVLYTEVVRDEGMVQLSVSVYSDGPAYLLVGGDEDSFARAVGTRPRLTVGLYLRMIRRALRGMSPQKMYRDFSVPIWPWYE